MSQEKREEQKWQFHKYTVVEAPSSDKEKLDRTLEQYKKEFSNVLEMMTKRFGEEQTEEVLENTEIIFFEIDFESEKEREEYKQYFKKEYTFGDRFEIDLEDFFTGRIEGKKFLYTEQEGDKQVKRQKILLPMVALAQKGEILGKIIEVKNENILHNISHEAGHLYISYDIYEYPSLEQAFNEGRCDDMGIEYTDLYNPKIVGTDYKVQIRNSSDGLEDIGISLARKRNDKSNGFPSGYQCYAAITDQMKTLVGEEQMDKAREGKETPYNWYHIERELTKRYGENGYRQIMQTMSNVVEFINPKTYTLLDEEQIAQKIEGIVQKIQMYTYEKEQTPDPTMKEIYQTKIVRLNGLTEALEKSSIKQEFLKLSDLVVDCMEQDAKSIDETDQEQVFERMRRLLKYKNQGLIKSENGGNEKFDSLYQKYVTPYMEPFKEDTQLIEPIFVKDTIKTADTIYVENIQGIYNIFVENSNGIHAQFVISPGVNLFTEASQKQQENYEMALQRGNLKKAYNFSDQFSDIKEKEQKGSLESSKEPKIDVMGNRTGKTLKASPEQTDKNKQQAAKLNKVVELIKTVVRSDNIKDAVRKLEHAVKNPDKQHKEQMGQKE